MNSKKRLLQDFVLGGDYMIQVCQDEVSDFTQQLHGVITFHLGKAEQFSTWYLFIFDSILF